MFYSARTLKNARSVFHVSPRCYATLAATAAATTAAAATAATAAATAAQ